MILMAFAFSVDELKTSRTVHGTDLVDPLNQNAAVGWLAAVKYRAKVVDLRLFMQSSLAGQKKEVLKKHHGKAAHQHIVQTMSDLSGLARIIDLPDALSDGGS